MIIVHSFLQIFFKHNLSSYHNVLTYQSTLLTIRGIISPLLITSTSQPISRLRSSIKRILCRVALLIIASSISTGFSIATGATTPDFPTLHITSTKDVLTHFG